MITDLTPEHVFKASAATGHCQRWLLRSTRRDEYIVKDRVAVALVLRHVLGLSWPAIGRELKRNHGSILRSCDQLKNDQDVKDAFVALCASLNVCASCAQAGEPAERGAA